MLMLIAKVVRNDLVVKYFKSFYKNKIIKHLTLP